MKVLKKITVKTVNGAKPDIEKVIAASKSGEHGGRLPIMEVLGIATGLKAGATDLGPFVKLTGTFRATNLQTGEMSRSGVAILPGAANDLVAGALGGLSTTAVEFGFKVFARYDKESATNYVYDVESTLVPSESDPLTMLESKISGKVSALPPPFPKGEPELYPHTHMPTRSENPAAQVEASPQVAPEKRQAGARK